MITRLTLTNWRAYEHLDLELGAGTTFIVAANGIGKSSIILAAAWGLLGDASGVDAKAAIRGDATQTSVAVEAVLPDRRQLRVARTVKIAGRPAAEVTLDGNIVGEEETKATLAAGFGVDAAILSRLAFMAEGGHLAAQEFDLRDHLYRVFGVADLLQTAEYAEAAAKDAKRARERLGQEERQVSASTAMLEAEMQDLDHQLEELTANRQQLEREVEAADRKRRIAQRWMDYQSTLTHRARRVDQALTKARTLMGPVEGEQAARAHLAEAERALHREIDEAAETLAAAKAQRTAAAEALRLISEAGARCPACLRPLREDEAATAAREHQAALVNATRRSAEANEAVEEAKTRLSAIRAALQQINAVQGPPAQPDEAPIELEDASREYATAVEALRAHDAKVTGLRTRRQQLLTQMRNDQEAQTAASNLRLAYRREALTQTAARTLRRTADSAITERIDPLTTEVAWRWKRLFGTEGLILKPDGRIRRQIGGRELEFEHLSGGEKIWALLVTRLLVLGASTRVPFVWLDEPLEHLDPKLRRTIAGTLVRAAGQGNLQQVIVTTYEVSLARQLAEDTSGARLITLRSQT